MISLDKMNLPTEKQQELQEILQELQKKAQPEFIILFGSFARGDWVADRYQEGHVTYEYLSDFDILVIVNSPKLKDNSGLWQAIQDEFSQNPHISTPVSVIVDTVDFVNHKLKEGNYFYSDIKKEGVLLYDSGKYKLSQPGILPPREKHDLALKDNEFWLNKSKVFFGDYKHNLSENNLNNAAFHLHQSVEAALIGVLLVYTGYRPKTHDLSKLLHMAKDIDSQFESIFPQNTPEEINRFGLLKRAYVDARYSMDYQIDLNDLIALAEHANKLRSLITDLNSKKVQQLQSLVSTAE